ncbi:methyl-accepting chemotaxis protein [Salinisphaera sp. RV14]|uniref:methyl-accepting chemotaxis protein n=1 Tax=Salinisphaera sp. RV14 TaxID=3454140 RepID=UPI003F87F301
MRHSLRARILAICIAIIVLSLVVIGAATWRVMNAYNNQSIAANLKSIATGHVMAIAQWSATEKRLVSSIGQRALQPDAASSMALIEKASQFSMVYAGYPDERFVSGSNWTPPPGFQPTQRIWYEQAAKAGHTVATKPYMDAATHKLAVPFATPVMKDGQLAAVVAGDMPLDRVVANVKAIKPTQHSYAFLVDGHGTVIAHPDTALALKPATKIDPRLTPQWLHQAASSGQVRRVSLDGVKERVLAEAIPNTDWTLVIAMNQREALAGLHSAGQTMLIALLITAVLAAAILWLALKPSFRRLAGVRDALDDIASGEGDLSRRLPVRGRDEIAGIAGAFNAFVERINDVLLHVRGTSESVRTASDEISQGSQDLSQRTEETAAQLEQSAAAVEQLTGTVEHSAASSRQASEVASEAAETARQGGQRMQAVNGAMQRMQDSSKKIEGILEMIDTIAFQTNLLALNASVEAARAGEHGRGFAVVAEEVRGLANRSTEAASEIKTLIADASQQTDIGVVEVEAADSAMQGIVQRIEQVSTMLVELTSAAAEQATGIGQVSQSVSQLEGMTQQNAALVEQSAAASEALHQQARELADTVAAFRLREADAGHARLDVGALPARGEVSGWGESEAAVSS